MKKLSPKAKKITMVTGIAVVCIGVLSAVLFQQASANSNNLPVASSSTASTNLVSFESGSVSVPPITENSGVASGAAGTGSAFTPAKGKTQSAPLTSTSKPAAPSKPKIQGDSQNGQQPVNKALTNKTQKPAYVTQPKASTNQTSGKTSGGTSTKQSGGSTTGSKTSGGSTKGNSVLDNAIKETGGNQQTTVGNSGDQLTGDKVGIMD
ncbi:MAG TPA: DUF6550 family protein [Caproicibacter sp.]|nr:DUF6550 family protein [Caproicibacter sp.]